MLMVPVDTENRHLMVRAQPLAVKLRRLSPPTHLHWTTSSPHGIGKHRYPVSTRNIFGLPVVFGRTFLDDSLSWMWLINPEVHTITTFFPPVAHSTSSHNVGVKRTALVSLGSRTFRGHRAFENPSPCFILRSQRYHPLPTPPPLRPDIDSSTEIAIVIIAIRRPNDTPLVQVHLASSRPRLFPHPLQGGQQYPHQQRNDSNDHQKFYECKSPSVVNANTPKKTITVHEYSV